MEELEEEESAFYAAESGHGVEWKLHSGFWLPKTYAVSIMEHIFCMLFGLPVYLVVFELPRQMRARY